MELKHQDGMGCSGADMKVRERLSVRSISENVDLRAMCTGR